MPSYRTRSTARQSRIVFLIACALGLASGSLARVTWRAAAAPPQNKTASPDGIWQGVDDTSLNRQTPSGRPQRLVRLNSAALSEELRKAPQDSPGALARSPAVLTLPLPDGGFARFRLVESPVMEPDLAERFPEIKTYRGQGMDDPSTEVRCDWSPRGFHAIVAFSETTVTVHQQRWDETSIYVSYHNRDYQGAAEELRCQADQVAELTLPLAAPASAFSVGPILRTYRIVIATTQEYTNDSSLGGGTTLGALASINTWLNNLNLIYGRELSVRFILVAGTTSVIYAAEPDPFTNGDTLAMINQSRTVLRDQIGTGNYDIGHVLGTGNGGQAYIRAVCNDNSGSGGFGPYKGGGASGMGAPVGNSGSLGLLAHEIGHQFGANHTFNDTSGNCGPNRSPSTAYESGGGLTIMSYVGVCSPNNISGARDPRFHAGSFAEITAYLGSIGGGCATQSATGNGVPIVNAGPDYNIPRNTPFTLSASASDADPPDIASLTYCWEQIDAGGMNFGSPPYSDTADAPGTTRPIFRPFSLTLSQARTFPSLSYILSNANVPPATVNGFPTAEYLPAVARALNFRCTVRDGRGGVNDDSVVLNVDGGSGPFLVTQPNTSATWSGSSQAVTWSVNNTNVSPVNCANVRITLSIDGGSTFPITLASSTPNDGSEIVTLPTNLFTTAARVKVEAIGNIFFDISDANFTVLPGGICPVLVGNGLSLSIGSVGASVGISGLNFTGVNSVKFNNNVSAAFTVLNDNLITATVPNGAVTGPITVSKPGCSEAQTGVFNVTACAPATLAIDDGSFEAFWGYATGNLTSYWVNRLTPSSYPATLGSVSIYFRLPVGTNLSVVVGTNPNGDANINDAVFQTRDVTVTAQNQFNTYSVPNVTINSGDFVVGFRFTPVDGVFPGSQDRSPPSNARSYVSTNGNIFSLFDSLGTEYAGNFGIRAQVYLPSLISPASQSFASSGGGGSVGVTIPGNCAWTATSNASWIDITAGASGSGNGTVNYAVSANSGANRTGTITIAGQPFVVRQGANFLDVDSNDAFSSFIGKLSAAGITVGCDPQGTLYCPNEMVTREQMAAFIVRALGEFNPSTPAQQRFSDVSPTNTFYPFIDQMASRGITVGCDPQGTMYCPGQVVTREQMAAFIIRALGMFNPPIPAQQRFADVFPGNPFYAFIDQMAIRGITVGCDPQGTLYCPGAGVTRAQMAAFLVRAFGL